MSPLPSFGGNDRFSRLDCPIKVRRAVKQTRRRSAVSGRGGMTLQSEDSLGRTHGDQLKS